MSTELIKKLNKIIRQQPTGEVVKLINTLCVYGNLYTIHFKRNVYSINNIGKHTETEELFVNYRNVDNLLSHYNRPYDMFTSEVDREKYPNVEQQYRMEVLSYTIKPDMCNHGKLIELERMIEDFIIEV